MWSEDSSYTSYLQQQQNAYLSELSYGMTLMRNHLGNYGVTLLTVHKWLYEKSVFVHILWGCVIHACNTARDKQEW